MKATILLVVALLFQAVATRTADIVVMTSGAFTAAYQELAPAFERSTKNKIVTAATGMGTGADSIPNRLRRGDNADVVIVAAEMLDALIESGSIVAGSRVDLARSSIGVAVRAGAPKPDIGSAEAVKRALLAARSVAYSASVSGDYLVNELFPRLGIAEEMKAKGRRIERERVAAVVARGEAELGFQQISELRPVAGVEIVGPLPPEIQRVTTFSVGVATRSANPDAARAFIRFLASPGAASVVEKTGLEPLVPATRR